jgi:hypothetical protein
VAVNTPQFAHPRVASFFAKRWNNQGIVTQGFATPCSSSHVAFIGERFGPCLQVHSTYVLACVRAEFEEPGNKRLHNVHAAPAVRIMGLTERGP